MAFVGRSSELRLLESLLADGSPTRTMLVHGPGGIGKSTLLTELAERAATSGYAVHRYDGMVLADAVVGLDELGDLAARDGRLLLVIDACDELGALSLQVRRRVADRASAGTRIVLASRRSLASAWHRGGWDANAETLHLRPMDTAEATELSSDRGVSDTDALDAIVKWAAGLPLALALGSDLVVRRAVTPAALSLDLDLATMLLEHVVGSDLHESHHRILMVSALAPAVDRALLSRLLPDLDADTSLDWFRRQTFTASAGARLRMHDSVRHIIVTSLSITAADEVREVRRRLADYYVTRALAGEPRAIIEMSRLVQDPRMRWGLGAQAGQLVQVSSARAEDLPEVIAATARGPSWNASIAKWFLEAPEHVVVVRDDAGALAGWGVAVTISNHPAWTSEDPVLGPWLEAAIAADPEHDAFLIRDIIDFGDPEAPVSSILAGGYAWFVQRMGSHSPRYSYAVETHNPRGDRNTTVWLDAMGYAARPALTVQDGETTKRCWVRDHGEGGMAGDTWRLVYQDLGLTPPEALPSRIGADELRSLLQSFHRPSELLDSQLGDGVARNERAGHVRDRLQRAVDDAFGSTRDERLLRDLVRMTYFETEGSHARTIERLPVSRATYFRHLDEALGRVARQISF